MSAHLFGLELRRTDALHHDHVQATEQHLFCGCTAIATLVTCLADDDFESIVRAIEESRTGRKSVRFA
jgi:hypothetical protein